MTSETSQETRLVRSFPKGDRIHMRGCTRAGRTVPWAWAEGRPDSEWVFISDLKACAYCLPSAYGFQKWLRTYE